jgi:hypothetical protein
MSKPLQISLFDGAFLLGPVPTLFSDDPKATEAAVEANLEKTHYDLQRLARLFHCGEELSLEEATNFVKKPKAGTALHPFKMPKFTAPPTDGGERRRTGEQRDEEPVGTSPKRRRGPEVEFVNSQGMI